MPPLNRPRRVLILEDEEPWRKVLARILQGEGFLVDTATNPNEAASLLKENLYHLLVLDISMEIGNPEDRQGMDFLRQLYEEGKSEAFIVIIISGYGNPARFREAFAQYGVKDFVEKRDFDNFRFIQDLARVWGKFSQIKLDLPIEWQNVKGAEEAVLNLRVDGARVKPSTPLQARLAIEIEDLLCRLFHKAEAIAAEPMQRGKSGAGVLRVLPVYPGLAGHSVVVKFGDAQDIRQETENFHRFVQGFLGGARSTSIQATQRTPLLGGICYSLLGAARGDFEDFSALYRRSDAGAIRSVLDNLFRDTCAAWYAGPGHLQLHDLASEYQSLLGLTPEKLEEPLRKGLKNVQGKERLRFSSLASDRSFVNPILVGFDRKLVKLTYACTTHGDLNANNILVDQSGSTWLIDFLRTGPGHILRDFAQLDATVRLLLLAPEEATLEERLEMEEALLGIDRFSEVPSLQTRLPTSNKAVAKTFATSVHLRMLAAEQVGRNPKDDLGEYYVASLYFAMSMIRYWDLPTVQREHALLTAALLAEQLGL
jgi:CheY-like chemotaxis protein